MSSLRLQTRQLTFLRILFPFLAGVTVSLFSSLSISFNVLLLLIALVVLGFITFNNKQINQTTWKKYKGKLINVSFFIVGLVGTGLHNELMSSEHFTKKTATSFVIYVNDVPIRKGKQVKFNAKVVKVNKKERLSDCSGNLLVTLETTDSVGYGTYLLIPSKYKLMDPPQNPYEFDYKQYLGFKNIHYQTYLKKSEFRIIPVEPKHNLTYYALKLREKCVQRFNKYITERENAGIVSAFLLGYRADLSPDIVNAFTNTGTVHILSVSGLHVGIIYIVINYLLGFLDKVKGGRYIKVLLTLLLTWFYASITGFSPAVCRAAFMISIIATAQGFNRYTNIYNSIAVSLFFLLLFNPYLLVDVGFQLSYLAVLGIIYFQPKIYRWIKLDNWLLNQLWLMSSVSIAAQLVTFPLSVYYFHQFPNYFLVANILIIPLASIILYGGILLLLVSPVSILGSGVGWALSNVISLMNLILYKLSHLPFAIFQNLMIDEFQLTIMVVAIVILGYLMISRKTLLKLSFLACMTALCCSFAFKSYHSSKQKEMIVFALKSTTAMGFTDGQTLYLYADSVLPEKQFNFSIQPYILHLGIKSVQYLQKKSENVHLLKQYNFIQFYNLRIGVIDSKFRPYEVNKKLKVDYLLISGKHKVDPKQLLQLFDTKCIVIDNSVPEYRATQIQEQCKILGKDIVNIHQSQALRISI
ncbi:ComEC/Rec2 family competence protein [Solitalea canadensis]|uniref:ComEC/Rec2-related protein n=1 Tax=Solitalea canadensis (strain ATCC 29591 / DSM 3403 / JCM 21819 / LMG 8368 / NBRC 15130 / NCIMB 12057 / USAM 9D) TaxID=929556 RepID=H8KQZ0_SOLCM|nr:ComEC/Rec2 family competence protein [Solitalea canadensis]AFD07136.1 ComEC/Rec2-related protein [Solitalea canadensis DSM 3403]